MIELEESFRISKTVSPVCYHPVVSGFYHSIYIINSFPTYQE